MSAVPAQQLSGLLICCERDGDDTCLSIILSLSLPLLLSLELHDMHIVEIVLRSSQHFKISQDIEKTGIAKTKS